MGEWSGVGVEVSGVGGRVKQVFWTRLFDDLGCRNVDLDGDANGYYGMLVCETIEVRRRGEVK